MTLDRRDFMAAASAATALAAGATDARAVPAEILPGMWHQSVKRVCQVNLNEKDILDMDVEAWADLLAETSMQAVYINVAGSLSFYPSKVPDFYPSQFLHGRDLTGECVAAAKKRGIPVIIRFSPDIAQTRAAEKHPQWFRRDKTGGFVTGHGTTTLPPGYAQTCQFTTYYTEQIPAIMHEILGRYDIDGMYTNGWPNTTVVPCYCDVCRKIGDPSSGEYKKAYSERAVHLWTMYTEIVQKDRKDRLFTGNLGGGMKGAELDLMALTRNTAWFIADYQARPAGMPAWDAAQQVRIGNAIMKGRPVQLCTATYLRAGDIVWRQGAGNPAEVETRAAQCFATGGCFYWHWLGWHQSFVEDRRLQENGKAMMKWQARHDAHFHTTASLAKVAIVAAPNSNRIYKAPEATQSTDSVQGAYAVLLDARIPFDLILESDLGDLSRYKAVVLPNVACLSDKQAAQIMAYVKAGGSLLTTFETGLYDETGKPRPDFALASLLDMHKAGERGDSHKPLPGAAPYPATAIHYQHLERPHPITAGFHDTTRILGPNWTIPIKADGAPIMTLIDPYPGYPTEQAYSRFPHTDKPAIVLREIGGARLAHLAGDVEGTYYRTDSNDLGELFVATLRWLIRDEPGITVDGDGLMEVVGWQTRPGYALHLVNYTNPAAEKGVFRRHYGVGAQTVRMTLPSEVPIRKAMLLRAEAPLAFTQRGQELTFTVPRVLDYEVAAFEV